MVTIAMGRVEQYGVWEAWFRGDSGDAHPYRDLTAAAVLRGPDGREHRIALFWYGDEPDGVSVWGLRYSPDSPGTWHYRLESVAPQTAAPLTGPFSWPGGTFNCLPGVRHGGLVAMPGYPLHLQWQDGTPVWLLGDTQWRAFATNEERRLNRESVLHGLDERAAQGFNYIHVDLMGGAGIDGGQRVFLDWAGERPNAAYWREVDARVRAMNARGIAAGMVLAWSRGTESWAAFASDEACLRYARYVVARYSAMNVVFIVAGEWDLDGEQDAARYAAIGGAIAAADPHGRLRAIHAGRGHTVERFAGQPWMSLGDYQQMYRAPRDREATADERRSLHNHLLAPRVHAKPVVNAEYAYYLRDMSNDRWYGPEPVAGVDKEHSHTRVSFRRASWVLAMTGGYFVTGFGTTYYGGWRNDGPFDVDDPRNDPAEQDIAFLAGVFRALPWWRLEPMDALVQTPEGHAYALAELGRTILVYCEGTPHVDLLIDGEPGTDYDVTRYDPRTGTATALGPAVPTVLATAPAATGRISLPCPDRDDWAFLVRARDTNPTAQEPAS